MMIIQGIPGAFAYDSCQDLDEGDSLGAGCRRRNRYADMDGDFDEEEAIDPEGDEQELPVEPDEWSDEPEVFDLCDELAQAGGVR